MRHRRLEQMPGAIQLVRVAQVRPAPPRSLHDEKAVQISVGQLRRRERGDELLELFFQRRVRMRRQ